MADEAARAQLPLSGIRVIALEQAVAGPFCSRQLADLGADVIKIERPDGGDFARAYDGAVHALSAYFAWLNRGKRSVVLDLKQEENRDLCLQLVRRADVLIHNLGPGVIERLGLAYEHLHKLHSALIWCGISGYGPDGPYRDKKAYDLLVQAEAGVTSLTGQPEAPAKVGISIADIAAGLYGYSSILAALINRGRTGHGERIEISMLECLTEWMMPALYFWYGTGASPARAGMRHNMIVPYGAYICADGAINLAVQNQREWRRFCATVLERPEIADDTRYATNSDRLRNRVELESLIENQFRKYSRAEVLSRLEKAEIANGSVNDVAEVMSTNNCKRRRRWAQVASPVGTIPALIPPHNLVDVPAHMGAVPALGEHTREVLDWLREKQK